jgi:hypothetical protein
MPPVFIIWVFLTYFQIHTSAITVSHSACHKKIRSARHNENKILKQFLCFSPDIVTSSINLAQLCRFHLKTETESRLQNICVANENRMMHNVQKHNNCMGIMCWKCHSWREWLDGNHSVQHFCQQMASTVICQCLNERTGFHSIHICGPLKVKWISIVRFSM